MTAEPRITCSICGQEVDGRVPPGGDGSVLFPYRHNRRVDGAERRCPGIDVGAYPVEEDQS